MHVRLFDLVLSRFGSQVLRRNVARSTAPRFPSQPPDTVQSNDSNSCEGSSSIYENTPLPRPQRPPQHNLTLYDFEGSPWCRLVREYATILDLTIDIRPCPRQTLFYGEGSFTSESRYRPEAMKLYKQQQQQKKEKEKKRNNMKLDGNKTEDEIEANDNDLTFPLLVDRTPQEYNDNGTNDVIVLTESYEIVKHLWTRYGKNIIPTMNNNNKSKNHNNLKTQRRRPDQYINSNTIPFIVRFLSLCGPSYVRPWPRCGIMRFPTTQRRKSSSKNNVIVLYQSEGCPESRLVREVLCSLEIPYKSIPVTDDGSSSNNLPTIMISSSFSSKTAAITRIPVLEIVEHNNEDNDDSNNNNNNIVYRVGAIDCVNYLRENWYHDFNHKDENGNNNNNNSNKLGDRDPTWFDELPDTSTITHNNGRIKKSNIERHCHKGGSISTGAYTAFLKGSRSFVPNQVFR